MLFFGPRFLLSLLVLSCGIAFTQSEGICHAATLKWPMAAEIPECASAAAPGQTAAVQQGLDRAFHETARGPEALAALACTEETEEKLEPELDVIDAGDASAGARAHGKSAQPEHNGKGASEDGGKEGRYGKGKAVDEAKEWEWDWIHWGAWSRHGGAGCLIGPSGGIVPPGAVEPESLSGPKSPKNTLRGEKKNPRRMNP